MPYVVTMADTVTCNHGGPLQKVPALKLVVENKPVVTSLGAVTPPPPCTMQTTTAAPTNVPCSTVSVSQGTATKLKVSGQPVLLGSLAGTANAPASPGGALIATVAAKKLSAV